jgi:hypothetical protein
MPAAEIVNRMLKNGLGSLHEKQAAAVRAGVVAALEGEWLSLSRLAQRVSGEVALRQRVQADGSLAGK